MDQKVAVLKQCLTLVNMYILLTVFSVFLMALVRIISLDITARLW